MFFSGRQLLTNTDADMYFTNRRNSAVFRDVLIIAVYRSDVFNFES